MATSTGPVSRDAPRPLRLWRRLLHVPLATKILVANGAIVALGAIVGAYLTTLYVRQSPSDTPFGLMALLALGGVVLSLVLNSLVLRTALRPLVRLERTARQVQAGDLNARAEVDSAGDPATDQLVAAFNGMLDGLRDRTRHVETYAARLQALADQMLLTQEEERRLLAGQLLDDAGQSLATLLLQLRLLRDASAQPGADAAAIGQPMGELAEMVRATLANVRGLAQELRPRVLDDLGLAAAVQSAAEEWQARTGVPVDARLSVPADVRVPPAIGIAVYRLMQEALASVAARAPVTAVRVTLAYTQGDLVAEVWDDGRGPADSGAAPAAPSDPAAATPAPAAGLLPRLGLFAMQERISLVGGHCTIESAPGQGTTIRAAIPLPAEAGDTDPDGGAAPPSGTGGAPAFRAPTNGYGWTAPVGPAAPPAARTAT